MMLLVSSGTISGTRCFTDRFVEQDVSYLTNLTLRLKNEIRLLKDDVRSRDRIISSLSRTAALPTVDYDLDSQQFIPPEVITGKALVDTRGGFSYYQGIAASTHYQRVVLM